MTTSRDGVFSRIVFQRRLTGILLTWNEQLSGWRNFWQKWHFRTKRCRMTNYWHKPSTPGITEKLFEATVLFSTRWVVSRIRRDVSSRGEYTTCLWRWCKTQTGRSRWHISFDRRLRKVSLIGNFKRNWLEHETLGIMASISFSQVTWFSTGEIRSEIHHNMPGLEDLMWVLLESWRWRHVKKKMEDSNLLAWCGSWRDLDWWRWRPSRFDQLQLVRPLYMNYNAQFNYPGPSAVWSKVWREKPSKTTLEKGRVQEREWQWIQLKMREDILQEEEDIMRNNLEHLQICLHQEVDFVIAVGVHWERQWHQKISQTTAGVLNLPGKIAWTLVSLRRLRPRFGRRNTTAWRLRSRCHNKHGVGRSFVETQWAISWVPWRDEPSKSQRGDSVMKRRRNSQEQSNQKWTSLSSLKHYKLCHHTYNQIESKQCECVGFLLGRSWILAVSNLKQEPWCWGTKTKSTPIDLHLHLRWLVIADRCYFSGRRINKQRWRRATSPQRSYKVMNVIATCI